ncbi:sensor domain-containing diguanylate cyclase [Oceanospirillum sediminis]|uniref:diguanylate cyclase n=1 Tax=Oceanospirillum sediminis TaxID=2760088 RepID=A0A839IPH3_9GAMM|nr:diguanylate cyclase [Oceanospirillum sediminis]MBB1487155.1 diguanylate cyclase [Oceanospirillum sediminis]
MKFLGKQTVFIWVSLVILVLDSLFIAINYWQDKDDLQRTLEMEGKRLQTAFHISQQMTLSNMSQLATFVANDPEVRMLFGAAVNGLESQGYDYASDTIDELRKQLYNEVSSSWKKMTEQYHVRQLHFHTGPGSTSFLRVHKPEKFGDNMDNLRHIIVDVNRDGIPRTGLELGRIYSGLRGVVPVFDHQMNQVGALEAGTSYRAIIQLLSESIKASVAVMMKEQRVEEATWVRPEEALKTHCGCFIEASSDDSLKYLMATETPFSRHDFQLRTQLINTDKGAFAVTHFGIQDYIGQRDQHTEPVGRVFLWYPADELLNDMEADTWLNVMIALVGFIILEVILYLALRFSQRHLRREVRRRTHEVEQLNEQLMLQASTDALTGLYNRRFLTQRFEEEFERAKRKDIPLSMVILDLDHFKQINDTYGHSTGDQVLKQVGSYLKSMSRKYDVAARYGGEEFCVLLPGCDQQTALNFAERLCTGFRKTIAIEEGNTRQAVTCSVGVCEKHYATSADQLLSLADAALYAAKQQGRDRVVVYEKRPVRKGTKVDA